MKSLVTCAIVFSLMAVTGSSPAFAQSPKNVEESVHVVKGSGCLRPGTEAGCFVVSDLKTQKLYNLLFSGEKPSPDVAIEFVGVVHDGPTICMQGTAISVKKWTALKMKCASPSKETIP